MEWPLGDHMSEKSPCRTAFEEVWPDYSSSRHRDCDHSETPARKIACASAFLVTDQSGARSDVTILRVA
jgi:hypothetical protein